MLGLRDSESLMMNFDHEAEITTKTVVITKSVAWSDLTDISK